MPLTHRFEKISVGSNSGLEIHNMHGGCINPQNFLMGTIGSHGGGSDDCNKYVNPLGRRMEKKDSEQSFMSSQGFQSWNDGGPFDVMKLLNGEETRTNLMVKNVPCRYTQ
jgi:hypothetical protein